MTQMMNSKNRFESLIPKVVLEWTRVGQVRADGSHRKMISLKTASNQDLDLLKPIYFSDMDSVKAQASVRATSPSAISRHTVKTRTKAALEGEQSVKEEELNQGSSEQVFKEKRPVNVHHHFKGTRNQVHPFDRKSGTGRDRDFRKGGKGKGGWEMKDQFQFDLGDLKEPQTEDQTEYQEMISAKDYFSEHQVAGNVVEGRKVAKIRGHFEMVQKQNESGFNQKVDKRQRRHSQREFATNLIMCFH